MRVTFRLDILKLQRRIAIRFVKVLLASSFKRTTFKSKNAQANWGDDTADYQEVYTGVDNGQNYHSRRELEDIDQSRRASAYAEQSAHCHGYN